MLNIRPSRPPFFPFSIYSNWTLWSRTGNCHSAILRNLSKWKATMRPSYIEWPWFRSNLYAEAITFASNGEHTSQRGDLGAKDETIVEVLQEWIRFIELAAVLSSLPNDDAQDFSQPYRAVDSVFPPLRLWTFYWTHFLQLGQRRKANVWSPEVLYGRDFFRRLHADNGADLIMYVWNGNFFIWTLTPTMCYFTDPSELRVVKKECFNRWYGLTPYYLALTISRLPIQIVFNVIFSTLVYFLAGLPLEPWRFVMFALIGVIVSFVAEGLGLAIGATFNVTVGWKTLNFLPLNSKYYCISQNGCAVGPMLIAPFLGLAIYGFDFAADIPAVMNAFMKLSFIRGGVVSLVLTVFGHNRQQLICSDVYCHFDDPKVLLRYLRIENFSLFTEIGFLLAILVLFRTLFYLSLRKRFYK